MVYYHLQQIGNIPDLGEWIPDDLTEAHSIEGDICTHVNSCHHCGQIGIIKCVFYQNINRCRPYLCGSKYAKAQLPLNVTSTTTHLLSTIRTSKRCFEGR